jgi:hypothetical protein
MSVVEQAVEHGTDRGAVAEQFSPVFHGAVGSEQRAGTFVTAHDDLQQLFFRDYHGKNPFVLKNKVTHWPASRLWSPEYLTRWYGDVTVALELYDPQDGSQTFADQMLFTPRRTIILREYLNMLNSYDSRYAVREDADLFEHYPQILEELSYLSPFRSMACKSDGRYKSLWIGPPDYVTGLHTGVIGLFRSCRESESISEDGIVIIADQ